MGVCPKPDGKLGELLGVRPVGSEGDVFKPEGNAGAFEFGLASPAGNFGAGLKPDGSAGVFVAGASPLGKGGAA
ncbi:MAG: hypothetical protein K9L22_07235 [Methylococcaceae bacterium]|nr:hypothetical protein [Methylococcaceae bacterium]